MGRGAELSASTSYPSPIVAGMTNIAWIGIGVMGSAMARRLQNIGHRVTIYARTPSKAHHLLQTTNDTKIPPAVLAPTPSAAVANSDVTFLMLSHPSDVRSIVLNNNSGILLSLRPNSIIVDMTSSSPSLAIEIAEAARSKGCYSIDAPVSGGDIGARDGSLAIFAGGEPEVIQWLSPLFHAMGSVTRIGKEGAGQSCKIANQIAAAGSLVGLAEALVFAMRSGLDVEKFIATAQEEEAASGMMRIFGERMVRREFEGGAFAEYMVKDLGLALGISEDDESKGTERGAVVLEGTALWKQMFEGVVAGGNRKIGLQGLLTVIERINGLDTDSFPY